MNSKLNMQKLKELLNKEMPASDELLNLLKEDERKAVKTLLKGYYTKLADFQRVRQMYQYEAQAYLQGKKLIAGVDEVGRGPLAGPVVAAAVILPENLYLPHLNDSKKVTAKRREELYEQILEKAICVQVAFVDAPTIDRVNIYQATMNAMYNAIYGLSVKPEYVLVDAMPLESLEIPHEAIIQGDAKSASIAAASIVAKVERDRLMKEYDSTYPGYDFGNNSGYGTAKHLEGLSLLGPCPIHRRSFEPIKSMVK